MRGFGCRPLGDAASWLAIWITCLEGPEVRGLGSGVAAAFAPSPAGFGAFAPGSLSSGFRV